MAHVTGPGGTYRVFDQQLPTLHAALQMVLAVSPSEPNIELVTLTDSFGRALAADVIATDDIPAFDRSTVDGYAVRSADVAAAADGQAVTLRWVGEVRMGEPARVTVATGEAVSVATGAMLPPGADAVVMIEDTATPGTVDAHPGARQLVDIRRAVEPGTNVLAAGSDVRSGAAVLRRGAWLGPAQIGALAAAGATEVPVSLRPRVAVIATGDELVAPHQQPGIGAVRDANSVALAAAIRRDGGIPWLVGRIGDDPAALRAGLELCRAAADIVLISGGSSVGVRDVTVEAVTGAGGEVLLHGIAVKPGKPTLVARLDRTLVFGIPGNPVSALVIHDVLVRPVIRRFLGLEPAVRWQFAGARLATPLRRPPNREELVRVRLDGEGDERKAYLVPGTSGMLQSLAQADGYVWIGFDRHGFDAGEPVTVWTIPGD